MKIYTVYRKPRDFPEAAYVVRGCIIGDMSIKFDNEPLYAGGSLVAAREAIHGANATAVRVARDVKDDPVIEEIWL